MNFVIQSTLYSGLLYFAYLILFRNFSFLKLNRVLLLAIPFISVAIPLMAPLFEAPKLTREIAVALPEITLGQGIADQGGTATQFNWWQWTYLAGVGLSLFIFIKGLFKAYSLVATAEKWQANILISRKAEGPFAFFRKVVIPIEMKNQKELPSIIRHEEAHVKLNHAFDNSFYALLCSLLWFNPFFHLLFKELKQVHECQADQAALGGTNHEDYSRLLLAKTFGQEISTLTASPFFNSSLIKTRITMIYKAKTKNKMKGLYLALLPLLAAMVIISCSKQDEAVVNEPTSPASEVKGFAEADQPPLFEDCDANAPKEEQLTCFQKGIYQQVFDGFKYPEKLKQVGIEGNMYVQFTIGKDGKVRDAKVVRSLPAETDAEKEAVAEAEAQALRLVNDLPTLNPAIVEGKKAAVKFTLPFNLKLS